MKVGSFVGHLGQDVEVKASSNGQVYAKLSIAVDRGKDREGAKRNALWVRGTIWGTRAEKLAPFLKKGNMVAIAGEIDLNEWTSKDGEKHADIECNVSTFSFAGGGDKKEESEPQAAPVGCSTIDDSVDIPF